MLPLLFSLLGVYNTTQARRQDLAAGGAKNQKGGHILKIQ